MTWGASPETAALTAGPLPEKSDVASSRGPVTGRGTDSPGVPAVDMLDIVKVYGANAANYGVRFVVNRGEIHAVQNGAGKTTLMNILYGLARPDSGEIRVDGVTREIRSPQHALALGIGMVHQTFMLVPTFTVAEAVVLGTGVGDVFSSARTRRHASRSAPSDTEYSASPASPRLRPAGRLQAARRDSQAALPWRTDADPDEPTSVLGPVESAALFDTLDTLRAGGASIVIVTHKLREVMAMADRVSVLRRGKNVLQAARGEYDAESLARAMGP